MNIIYRLTNKTKETGRRFYVGFKIDCVIEDVAGVPTIFHEVTRKPYYGSSQCPEMIRDLKSGHVFSAEALEIVSDKRKSTMVERETFWMKELDAVDSSDYYNLSTPLQHTRCNVNYESVCNRFGESLKEYAKNQSVVSRRDIWAKRAGFSNFYELVVYIWEQIDLGRSGADIAEQLGLERHYPVRMLKAFNKERCLLQLSSLDYDESSKKIRQGILEGGSLMAVARYYDIELPVARYLLGDFNLVGSRSFVAATKLSLTKDELELKIAKAILDGDGFKKVAKDVGLPDKTVSRYFLRFIRSRLKSSDL